MQRTSVMLIIIRSSPSKDGGTTSNRANPTEFAGAPFAFGVPTVR